MTKPDIEVYLFPNGVVSEEYWWRELIDRRKYPYREVGHASMGKVSEVSGDVVCAIISQDYMDVENLHVDYFETYEPGEREGVIWMDSLEQCSDL